MTYTFPLTIDETRELLEEAVNERGHDYVYKSPDKTNGQCFYWHDTENKPGCGVGDVAFRAGIPVENIRAADKVDGRLLTIERNPALKGFFDTESLAYLLRFQTYQDDKEDWGDAFEAAEDYREQVLATTAE